MRESLCISGDRWKDSVRKRTGYLYCGIGWPTDQKGLCGGNGRIGKYGEQRTARPITDCGNEHSLYDVFAGLLSGLPAEGGY